MVQILPSPLFADTVRSCGWVTTKVGFITHIGSRPEGSVGETRLQTFIRFQQPSEHIDGGRLARSVVTYKAREK